MSWVTETGRRIVFLLRRRRFDEDFDEEVRFHLEMEAQANRAAGMAEGEAGDAARRRLGNAASLRDRARDQWGWTPLEDFVRDVRYAGRTLRRSPGFVAVALVSLAFGIGLNLGVFQFVYALFLRPFPAVSDSPRLVAIYHHTPRGGYDSSPYPEFEYYRGATRAFSSLAAFSTWGVIVRVGEVVDEVDAELVSPEYFTTLGLTPAAGRLLSPDDAQPGADVAVVLSERYWARRFGRDPEAIGRRIVVGEAAGTIVGVAARGFEGLSSESAPALWASVTTYRSTVPLLASLQDDPRDVLLTNWGNHSFSIVGRLRPGWTLDAAAHDMAAVSRHAAADHPERAQHGRDPASTVVLLPAVASRFWPGRQAEVHALVWLLVGVAVLILLIACFNVASLVLARTTRRRHELAVRLSLGAGRARVVRQLLTENLLVTTFGAALGFIVGEWTVDVLSRMGPSFFGGSTQFNLAASIDWVGVVAAVGFALLAACLVTVLPLRLLRVASVTAFLEGSGRTGGRRRTGVHQALVCAQIALSVVLVVTSGLFVRTLQNARAANTTVDREHLLLATVDLTSPAYAAAAPRASLYADFLERVRAIPGVRDAGLVFVVPHGGRRGGTQIVLDAADTGDNRERNVGFNAVTPGYFRTAGFPLVAGRDFGDQDGAQAPPVAIINEVMAARLYPARSPLGHRFVLDWPPAGPVEVVGVVRDGGRWKYRSQGEPIVYVPAGQRPMRAMTLVARSLGDPEAIAAPSRQALSALASSLTLTEVQTARAFFDSRLARERITAFLLSILAALALLLAAVGVFGVFSYAVAQETREIGVRLAVGATPTAIVRGVLTRTARLAAVGLAVGTACALALGRLVRGLLFGVTSSDPVVVASTLLVLLGVALAAGYVPARRASRIDPVAAIRTE